MKTWQNYEGKKFRKLRMEPLGVTVYYLDVYSKTKKVLISFSLPFTDYQESRWYRAIKLAAFRRKIQRDIVR